MTRKPKKKMKFTEMFLKIVREELSGNSVDDATAAILALARTLDRFLPEIEVPDEKT